MELSVKRTWILEEIQRIPEERLAEVYAILHYFRVGLEASQNKGRSVMQFAGCWQDMPEETFASFLEEVTVRRQVAFSRRRQHADGLD